MGLGTYHPNRSVNRDSKPVKEGHTYQLEITSEGKQGDGVAIYHGLVIFVPGAKVGETHNVKILQVRRTTAIGEVAK